LVGDPAVEALFFASAADYRRWLEEHHSSASDVWVGIRKGTGRQVDRGGLTYAEAVDEALCFGWIDSRLRGLDETSYAQRFTPRRPGSNWSATNVKRVGELIAAGRMRPAGLHAFEQRRTDRATEYTYATRPADLPEEFAAMFRRHEEAWRFFSSTPSSYRRSMAWWIVSARRQETRLRRLAAVIDESAAGRRIDPMNLPRLTPERRRRVVGCGEER
jgi:uncharacterized protein YdeI (YjbR/CyaY-like superfamily)